MDSYTLDTLFFSSKFVLHTYIFFHLGAKKDASINRRQVSDLSSASDYSATAQSQTNSASSNKNSTNNPKSMTTGGTRRVQRGGVTANNTNTTSSTSTPHGTKSTNSTSTTGGTTGSAKSQGIKGSSQTSEVAKKKGASSNQTSTTRGKLNKK